MTEKQFIDFSTNIESTIRLTVNGKIDKINDKIDNYIKADTEWKERVTPSIDLMEKIGGFSDGTLFTLKLIGLIGAATAVIYGLIDYLKK